MGFIPQIHPIPKPIFGKETRAVTFPIPSTGQPQYSSISKPGAQKRQTMASPVFGRVEKYAGDRVQFGHTAPPEPDQTVLPELVAIPPKSDQAHLNRKKAHPSQSRPIHPYGRLQNNIREGARIVLCDVLPLALSVPMLGGVPGFLLAMAGMPISYMAGKTGRWIARDVDHENLIPVFKYISTVKGVLISSQGGHENQMVDLLNKATDDFLNIRGGGGLVKTWLLQRLMLRKDKGVGRMLTKFSIWRAEVNTRLARAENLAEAGKAAANGVKDFALYSILNKIGTALVAFGGKSILFLPIRWIGHMMKNAAWLKIAADVMLTAKSGEKH